MFSMAGNKSSEFELDLSSWNMKNTFNMKNMFRNAGANASLWNVKIPSSTGNISNTTSMLYGKTRETFAEVTEGRSFTLS